MLGKEIDGMRVLANAGVGAFTALAALAATGQNYNLQVLLAAAFVQGGLAAFLDLKTQAEKTGQTRLWLIF
jgi:hypothetical protein